MTIIVRNNPNESTVHFDGPCREAIREDYMCIILGASMRAGQLGWGRPSKMSQRHFLHPPFCDRSLSTTLFTKPALPLRKKASIKNRGSCGLIQGDSALARHSPGEYSALRLLLRLCLLLSVVFYCGLTMLVATERDTERKSNYSKIAVNTGVPRLPMSKPFSTLLIKSRT